MVIKKIKRVYVEKSASKPVVIRFRKKDGSFVEFKGIKVTRKPKKVVFRKIKKVYYRPTVDGDKVEGKENE
jgi:hypothetical protein